MVSCPPLKRVRGGKRERARRVRIGETKEDVVSETGRGGCESCGSLGPHLGVWGDCCRGWRWKCDGAMGKMWSLVLERRADRWLCREARWERCDAPTG